jgi:hypothetical protein
MNDANRAKTHLSINNEIRFSHSIVDHFQWFKLHWLQHTKNYKIHGMIWRKKRFESLLGFEEKLEIVMD